MVNSDTGRREMSWGGIPTAQGRSTEDRVGFIPGPRVRIEGYLQQVVSQMEDTVRNRYPWCIAVINGISCRRKYGNVLNSTGKLSGKGITLLWSRSTITGRILIMTSSRSPFCV